jgi:hypothetical protein
MEGSVLVPIFFAELAREAKQNLRGFTGCRETASSLVRHQPAPLLLSHLQGGEIWKKNARQPVVAVMTGRCAGENIDDARRPSLPAPWATGTWNDAVHKTTIF